jgi:hypothetical protein
MCPEYKRLADAYDEASTAVSAISVRLSAINDAQGTLMLEEAVAICNRAHFDLNHHLIEHHCADNESSRAEFPR